MTHTTVRRPERPHSRGSSPTPQRNIGGSVIVRFVGAMAILSSSAGRDLRERRCAHIGASSASRIGTSTMAVSFEYSSDVICIEQEMGSVSQREMLHVGSRGAAGGDSGSMLDYRLVMLDF